MVASLAFLQESRVSWVSRLFFFQLHYGVEADAFLTNSFLGRRFVYQITIILVFFVGLPTSLFSQSIQEKKLGGDTEKLGTRIF